MELYKDMGDDVNRRGLSFLATDDLMEVIEEKGYTKDTLSKLTDTHINTIYNIFKQKLVAEQTARKVCGVLGILFEEGFEPSKPVSALYRPFCRDGGKDYVDRIDCYIRKLDDTSRRILTNREMLANATAKSV
jgi:hypothetical protein